MQQQQPIDIYYNYEVDGTKSCKLELKAFLVLEMDEEKGVFSGYNLNERNKTERDRKVYEGFINTVCDIQ